MPLQVNSLPIYEDGTWNGLIQRTKRSLLWRWNSMKPVGASCRDHLECGTKYCRYSRGSQKKFTWSRSQKTSFCHISLTASRLLIFTLIILDNVTQHKIIYKNLFLIFILLVHSQHYYSCRVMSMCMMLWKGEVRNWWHCNLFFIFTGKISVPSGNPPEDETQTQLHQSDFLQNKHLLGGLKMSKNCKIIAMISYLKWRPASILWLYVQSE